VTAINRSVGAADRCSRAGWPAGLGASGPGAPATQVFMIVVTVAWITPIVFAALCRAAARSARTNKTRVTYRCRTT